jgi:hypothetical protein
MTYKVHGVMFLVLVAGAWALGQTTDLGKVKDLLY